MKRRYLITFSIIISCFSFSFDFENNNYHKFIGYIGKSNVFEILFYANTDGSIVGQFATYSNITIIRKNFFGNIIQNNGIFEIEHSFNQKMTMEGLFGTSEKETFIGNLIENSIKTPFNTYLTAIFPGSAENMYLSACSLDPDVVDNFALKVKTLILSGNVNVLSELINYPILVEIKKKKIEINSKNDFKINFSNIFYKEFLFSIKKHCHPFFLLPSPQGLMFGKRGQLWFRCIKTDSNDFKLKITSINNSQSGSWNLDQ